MELSDIGSMPVRDTDVLVIGGGPAGAAMGYWTAELGHSVTIVERKHFPREKTCGDGLTPRAVTRVAVADASAVSASRLCGAPSRT
jgi:flavin-dependent dehydrogenase